MKKISRFFAIALAGFTMSACSDDPAGVSGNSILNSLAASDPILAPMAAFSKYANVAPSSVEIDLDTGGAGASRGEGTETWQALGYEFTLAGAGNFGVILFYRVGPPVEVLYVAGTSLLGTSSIGGNPYAVYIPDVNALNSLGMEETIEDIDGIFFDDGDTADNGITIDSKSYNEDGRTVATCAQTQNTFEVEVSTFEVDGIDLHVDFVEFVAKGPATASADIVDQGPVGGIIVETLYCE